MAPELLRQYFATPSLKESSGSEYRLKLSLERHTSRLPFPGIIMHHAYLINAY